MSTDFEILKKQADEGDTNAQSEIGNMYFYKGTSEDREKGMKYLLAAAEQNNVNALYYLGYIYRFVGYPEKNFEKAYDAFSKASQLGDRDSMYYLSEMYIYGLGVDKNVTQGIDLLKHSADLGNMYSQNQLALCYLYGDFVDKNVNTAYDLFFKAANQGYSRSMYQLSFLYYDGIGVEKNLKLAFEWMHKAAEKGDTNAQFCLYQFYTDGEGVKVDSDKAIYWLKKSAEGNNAEAQNTLGSNYCEGIDVAQDFQKGKYWYERAVENGHTLAMLNLSLMYQYGDGVEADQKKAFELQLQAAECGDVEAQVLVGRRYAEGYGITLDYMKAKEWFEKAAEKNNPEGLCWLGLLYWRGWGVERDVEKSNYYMKQAADLGNIYAMENYGLSLLEGTGVEADREAGLKLLKEAAGKGNPEAASALYHELKNTNPEEAYEWLKQAAKGGATASLEFLISLLAQEEAKYDLENIKQGGNLKRKQDVEEYIYWLDVGIERKLPTAYTNKGRELISGKKINQDIEKGISYLSYASEQLDTSAMLEMADYYKDGFMPYIRQDIQKAVDLCKKVIEIMDSEEKEFQNGTAEAQLGEMYLNPRYGIQDISKGIALWEKAITKGNLVVNARLALLYSEAKWIPVQPDKALFYAKKYLESGGWNAQKIYGDIYDKFFSAKTENDSSEQDSIRSPQKRRGLFKFFKK